MTQYYCAIFNFDRGSGGVDMLSDTDAACVVIACVFRKEKRIAAGPMNVTKLNRPDPHNRRLTTYYIQVE